MQDRPTAQELLVTVEELLRETLMPALRGQASFHARVAANAMGIVRREIDSIADLDSRESERLRALLDREGPLDREGSLEELNRELCRRLRDGEMDLEDSALVDHLIRTTLGKISIDNPRYSGYVRALEIWPDLWDA